MTQCLAISGGKGGCGKTTTAVGLAMAFARAGLSPLVADTDHEMPDLHLVADVDPSPGLAATTAGADPTTVAHSLPDAPSVSVLPADGADGDELRTALVRVRTCDGPVLLDGPAGASRDAAMPLRAADRTLLVTTTTRESLRDTAKTAAMARELAAPPVGAVVVEPPTGDRTTVDSQDCQQLFNCPCLGRVPRAAGPPLASSHVRTAYENVAKKVQERNI